MGPPNTVTPQFYYAIFSLFSYQYFQLNEKVTGEVSRRRTVWQGSSRPPIREQRRLRSSEAGLS